MSDWDPGPLYRLCTDPECPVAYAYRAPFQETPHYHFIGKPMTTTPNVLDDYESDDALRRYALETQRMHDPAQQGDVIASIEPFPGRCALCHYTRHPCDVYELASVVLALLDRGRPDSSWEGRSPVGEYSGLAAEQFLDRNPPP